MFVYNVTDTRWEFQLLSQYRLLSEGDSKEDAEESESSRKDDQFPPREHYGATIGIGHHFQCGNDADETTSQRHSSGGDGSSLQEYVLNGAKGLIPQQHLEDAETQQARLQRPKIVREYRTPKSDTCPMVIHPVWRPKYLWVHVNEEW